MSELESRQPQADPIASLHKMSTTAGISTQEYVAINSLAIAAAALGAATALAVPWPVPFLLLGVAGIVCGILALRQIGNSNGTQTGKGLALGGIAASLLLAGISFASLVAQKVALRPDEQAMNATIEQIGNHVNAGQFAQAYALFDPEFQAEFPFPKFEQTWKFWLSSVGKLVTFRGNNIFEFPTNSQGPRVVITMAVVRFEQIENDTRFGMALRQQGDGQWKVLHLRQIFPAQDKSSRQ